MSERYKLASKIHNEVNLYPYANDSTVHGKSEFWEPIGTLERGDCEDYVLEKRKRLMASGIPPEDLRIGVAKMADGTSHAVLVIRDGETDWVADQRKPGLLTAADLKGMGYTGDRLQVPGQWEWEAWKI